MKLVNKVWFKIFCTIIVWIHKQCIMVQEILYHTNYVHIEANIKTLSSLAFFFWVTCLVGRFDPDSRSLWICAIYFEFELWNVNGFYCDEKCVRSGNDFFYFLNPFNIYFTVVWHLQQIYSKTVTVGNTTDANIINAGV